MVKLFTCLLLLPLLTSSFSLKQIPITVLSGFLGSGKTTLLQHLLNNKENLKIAVIVNDVAEVNIDGKLLNNNKNTAADNILQLQNGCACCNLSSDLLASVGEIVTLSDLRQEEEAFDHIVIELSGVSEPRAIRANFQEAEMYGNSLMERVRLDTMVTVVDCSSFLQYLRSSKGATPQDSPELFFRNDEEQAEEEERQRLYNDDDIDYMGNINQAFSNIFHNIKVESGVSELLIEQTEVADILLLNKIDMVGEATLQEVERVVKQLNTKAEVKRTKFGEVSSIMEVLGAYRGLGAADAGVVDDHKDAVRAVKDITSSTSHNHSHSHSHSHEHEHVHSDRHSHSHNDGEEKEELCGDPDCTDPSHSHSHAAHQHSHHHESDFNGINSFVYSARRPFHPERLFSRVVRKLPVTRGLPSTKAAAALEDGESSVDDVKSALSRLFRSKGFLWLADSNRAALYWAHAGASFEIQCLGSWWATLPRNQWPEDAIESILEDFDDDGHNEETFLCNDDGCSSVGDRRQEIVLIGLGVNNLIVREKIQQTLDSCLLNDAEWAEYKSYLKDDHGEIKSLRSRFPNPFDVRIVTY